MHTKKNLFQPNCVHAPKISRHMVNCPPPDTLRASSGLKERNGGCAHGNCGALYPLVNSHNYSHLQIDGKVDHHQISRDFLFH